jgi:hypothetical protein
MRIIINNEPFTLNSNYLEISHRLKGLNNYVVSGGDLVQLPHFRNKRSLPLKVIKPKTNQRLLYFYIDGRKVSRSELKSRIYKCKEKIQVWS